MTDHAQTILVVGGGIAGTVAALHIAGAGHRALLIDEAPTLGGAQILLDKTFPTDSCGLCFMAPDPPAICPFLECERNPGVEVQTSTSLTSLTGQSGAFKATLTTAPRYVAPGRCTDCGLCAEACPEVAKSSLLGAAWPGESHKAIYQPFPQAVPPTYVIDTAACTGCGKCQQVCPYDAINLKAKPKTRRVEVASVMLTPGFGPNDAHVRGAYGYGQYANVISSLEYERMLSTSSPAQGQPVRPSDGQPARRIAIVQCVGSRDHLCGVPYCSSVCCMIAAKQVSLTKRRSPQSSVTVFTMDVRAAGRGYERYVANVKSRQGVTYRRSLVSGVKLDPSTQNLTLQFAERGRSLAEPFDLVVLEVGMVVPPVLRALAGRIGVEVNEYGFVVTARHNPTATSRPGVFVAGAFREPKDVPATAAESAAAAAQALAVAGLLPVGEDREADDAQRLVTPSPYDPPAIGVFFDTGDPDLTLALNVNDLARQAQALPDVVHVSLRTDNKSIQAAIEKYRLTHVIVGTRSARRNGHRQPTLGGVPIIWVALGSADAFVHGSWPAPANQKACDLIGMAVGQARSMAVRPVQNDLPVQRALVIGGGIAGMSAACVLSVQGIETHLVEKVDRLGGSLAASVDAPWLADLIDRVETDPLITLHLSTTIAGLSRRPGHLVADLAHPDGECKIEAGTLVVATGAQEYRPEGPELGRVNFAVTQNELGALIRQWREASSSADLPASLVMLQCAGTRNADRPYCSKTCCADALRNALALKQIAPHTRIAILYRDMVTPGFAEDLYFDARRQGVLFLRYRSEMPPRIVGQTVTVHDDVLGEDVTLEADKLVLNSGIVPNPDTAALATTLGLPLNDDGFFKPVNIKSQVMDLPYRGLYLAGLAGGPATLEETIEQGMGAGLRAALFLRRALKTPLTVATVNERICSGCGLCVQACPVDARSLDPDRGVAQVDPWLCIGCGTCAAVCPNGASSQTLYEARGVLSALDAALG